MSSASITRAASPPAKRAAAKFSESCTAATTCGRTPRQGRLLSSSSALITSMSASSPEGGNTMIALAVSGLTSSRSARLSGLPERQITRVRPVSPRRDLISSSMSALSRSARMTTRERRWPWLALTSSSMTVNTCSDQPSRIVWPCSMRRDLPLRSWAMRFSRPVVSTPISELTMKMPPMVTVSIRPRNTGLPVSPPMVPGSMARIRVIHVTPSQPPFFSVSMWVKLATRAVTSAMSTIDAKPSQPIKAGVPRSIVPSNQYRRRSRNLIRTADAPPSIVITAKPAPGGRRVTIIEAGMAAGSG